MPLPSTILYPSGGGGGGAGDVVGPASSTDNAIARYDGTTGKLLQDSSVLVPDGLSGTVVIGSTGATDLAVIIANGTGGSTVQASAVTCTVAGTCTIPSAGQLKWSTDAGLKRLSAGNIAATDGSTGYGALAAIYIQASTDGLTTSKAGLFTATAPVTFAGLGLASGSVVNWSSGANSAWQTIDTGLARSAAGVVKVTDGSTGLGKLMVSDSLTGTGVIMFGGSAAGNASLSSSGTEIRAYAANLSAYGQFKGSAFRHNNGDVTMAQYGYYARRGTTGFFSTSGAVGDNPTSYEVGLTGSSAGVWDATANNASTPGAIRQSRPVEANAAGSGAPNVLAAIETNTVLTNEGSTATNYHTLPTAVAGYVFTFCVQDADGLRVTAAAADTIRVIDKVTASAGYIESTTIGSTVTLVAINATEWFATSIKGVWTDGTWSYDDTSLTTP